MSFGLKLKELRKQKKITQKDLGDLLGNTPPTT
ncbi:helix-turn-helix domain-containing protein, partial [Oenococcus oeni]